MILKTTFTLASLSGLLLTAGAVPALAVSGFTGVYAPGNFTFSSDPVDAGDAGFDLDTTNAAAGKVILFGPDTFNNGLSSQATYNEWTIAIDASRAGSVSFGWEYYNQFDDRVGFDSGGYVLNGTFFSLVSNNGTLNDDSNPQTSAAPVVLSLSAGDNFGFRVSSLDNLNGEGVFTVTNFQATPVPLESDALPIVLSAGFMGGGLWLKRRLKRAKG